MKKVVTTSLVSLGLLSSVSLDAAENLSTMFSEGKARGQIRMFAIDRDYVNKDLHRSGLSLGGHLKYETADYTGLSFGAAFYTVNRLDTWTDVAEPAIFGPNDGSYDLLGEAYLQYTRGNTTFKGGRQKLDTPLAGSDDARTLPNLFEAYIVTNTDIKDTTIVAGHITKFAQGTFGRVYDASADEANALLAVTAGYSAVDTRNQAGSFVNMGTYAIDEKTAGVTVAAAVYTGVENLKVQVWDYYAHDILNAIYADANYGVKLDGYSPYVAAQFIREDAIGDKLLGEVSSMYGAAKAGVKFGGFNVYAAYSQTTESNGNALLKSIITPWGGMPAYTQGMVTRHQFLAGTKATKVAGTYSFKDMGVNLSTTAYYASFDMDDNSGYGTARTATESGFDAIYYPEAVKNLQLRLRGNFPRDFIGTVGWNEYRFIVNYNF
ncbi:OprD family outer membrane porin [Sulfurimonas marina]|uniref:OprD family porin n=1 Tax=Sulfurimonas marina TaxID=2590551 RepID=A0A7M1AWZ6_9BACT|nr:OprD family outer membrane porin [Sulfurimonas marina]QOP40892.1 OprD family porin [Sulfurimonas marina]